MEISELQISQVNKQIEALIKAESFYGKKLEEAGITRENKKEKEAYRLEITPEGVHFQKKKT